MSNPTRAERIRRQAEIQKRNRVLLERAARHAEDSLGDSASLVYTPEEMGYKE